MTGSGQVKTEHRRADVIDVAIPADSNIREKQHETLGSTKAEGTTGTDVEGEVQSGPSGVDH